MVHKKYSCPEEMRANLSDPEYLPRDGVTVYNLSHNHYGYSKVFKKELNWYILTY